jgi:glycosyltransferase involved in cell wall biosynthesis
MSSETRIPASVVIPTLNAAPAISALLESLRAQSVPCEIIVIDSSSDDNTITLAASQGARVLQIDRCKFDHGGTRNLAVSTASAERVVFLTQDALPVNNRLLENILLPLDSSETPLSYGRQIARHDATPPEKFAREFNYPETPAVKDLAQVPALGIKAFYSSNVCSALRRKEFEEVGGFPDRIILNEDMVLAAKLIMKGYKVAYAAAAEVYHSHRYSLSQQFRRYFDIGVSLNRHRWILDAAKAETEGIRALSRQVRYLTERKAWRWVPYVALEAAFKYTGFRLGLAEDRLPTRVKRLLSMHTRFWESCDKMFDLKEIR